MRGLFLVCVLGLSGCVTWKPKDCNEMAVNIMASEKAAGNTFLGSKNGDGWSLAVFHDVMNGTKREYIIVVLDEKGENHKQMAETEPKWDFIGKCTVPVRGEVKEAGIYNYVTSIDTRAGI